MLSWSVPGCVDGWDQLRSRFGTSSCSQLLAPAIQYAEEGFPVTEIIAGFWKSGERIAAHYPEAAATYYPNGRARRHGRDVPQSEPGRQPAGRLPRGAATRFTAGRSREQIVAYSQSHGGYFSMKDFEDHTSNWVEPVSTNYRGYDVWELPPNGQGIAALEILNILEGYDLRSMGRHSPDYLHLFIEAKKLAYADRAKYYADPAFGKLPVARADLERVRRPAAQADRPAARGDLGRCRAIRCWPRGATRFTCAVVDKDRNCCSFIQSNFAGFGSHVVPGDVGFVMQNRGSQFSLDPKHLNTLEPHKRPFHTIIPAMVTKDGKPWLCFGVMGGDMQPQGHVQVLVNMIDFGLNVQAAGDEGRVRHDGSQTPTGRPMASGGGTVDVESSIPQATIDELTRRGPPRRPRLRRRLRRLPGHPHRPGARHPARRHRTPQRRSSGRVLREQGTGVRGKGSGESGINLAEGTQSVPLSSASSLPHPDPCPLPLLQHVLFPLFGDADFGNLDAEVFADLDRFALAIAMVVDKQIEQVFARLVEGDECAGSQGHDLSQRHLALRQAAR